MKKYIVVKSYNDTIIGSTLFTTDSKEDAKVFAELMRKTYESPYLVLQLVED